MLRRVDDGPEGSAPGAGEHAGHHVPPQVPPQVRPARALPPTPPPGDLGGLLGTSPVFPTRMHGYDRRQVDEYVSWAEEEVLTARRAGDQMRARLAACTAELAGLRGRPAPVPANPDLTAVSERVREILQLASDEAAAMVQAATEEADQIVADAQAETEARLARAALMRDAATALAQQLHEQVARQQAEAAALHEQARREADELLRAAAAERDRLAAEAAQQRDRDGQVARQQRDAAAAVAAGRLLAVKDEVDDLRRQRDEARASLRRLAEQVGQALRAAGAEMPDEPNIVSPVEPVAS